MKKSSNKASKALRKTVKARDEAFLPLLLASVSALLALLLMIIDKFIFPFGGDLLSPLLGQVAVLLIPTYLCLQLTSFGKSAKKVFDELGFGRLRAEYVFFIIFTALFMMSTTFLLNVLFYGIYRASEGFTVLGAFTAGVGEYSVSYPYLIVLYAVVPALIEEITFRGVIYKHLSGISRETAILLSSIVSAFFAFTLGGFPAALFTSLAYCFVRYMTGALQACIAVHLLFNLYAIFLQTNLSKYFLSSHNDLLIMMIAIMVWLICTALFSAECARLFKIKADRIKEGKEKSELPHFSLDALKNDGFAMLAHRPTLICACILFVTFVAAVVVRIF